MHQFGSAEMEEVINVEQELKPESAKKQCPLCDYTTSKNYLIRRHLKVHSDQRPHECTVCDKAFKSAAALVNHSNIHAGIKPHPCQNCEKCFTTSGELLRHVRYRHTHEKRYQCSYCDYQAVEMSKLKRHIYIHTGERPYQCRDCTYSCTDMFKLKRHMVTHTGEKPYICLLCKQTFTQSNSLKSHIKLHNPENEPRFQCELCPATVGRKTDLRIHIQKIHFLRKHIKCSLCNLLFTDKFLYRNHVREHAVKIWTCEVCSFGTKHKQSLKSHMLRHTNEKPFKCNECDINFRQKQLLKRHFNHYHNKSYVQPTAYERKFKCEYCTKKYAYGGHYQRHMTTHNAVISKANVAKNNAVIFETKEEVEDNEETTISIDDVEYIVVEVIQIKGSDGIDEMTVVAPM